MTFALATGAILVLAVLLGWLRLWRWQAAQPRGPRFWALLALQPLAAGLLWLALHPPAVTVPGSTLVVATRGAPPGAYDIRLPEAPASASDLAPDLATALRQRPATTVRVVGEGLEPRDRAMARTVSVQFAPPPSPTGLIRLDPPPPVGAGGRLQISGAAAGIDGGSVELLDPAGKRAALAELAPDGSFTLAGQVRAAGAADWKIVLRDTAGTPSDTADIPITALESPPPRLWVRAGAPGPELKYLARWAADAGLDFGSDVTLGGGVTMGDSPLAMTAATLARLDVLVLDERSWAGLSASARAAVLSAVRSGMGLVLRTSGPVPAPVRTAWSTLGLRLATGDTPRETRLAGGTTVQSLPLAPLGTDAIPWLRDTTGRPVAAWRSYGRGRIGLWPVLDSYALVLTGKSTAFAGLWSNMFSAVARSTATTRPDLPAWGYSGERVSICGLSSPAQMLTPGGTAIPLHPDPSARSCAGYWPITPGWHRLRSGDPVTETPLRILPADAHPNIRAAARREATLLLARSRPAAANTTADRSLPGPAWPWWLAFVAVAALLWWLERARLGRSAPEPI
ncbi:hypothetical protein FHS79_001662 [Polymorphobacter multimanifer]|uniref:Carboxypeptidase regulatory-like domain-containing protein n=1 Tax=Polymorphobacter multimanifer TaxID=1070431 RepID=A0A841L5F3_9SPHN|nr:carboxypeptidase regulatory-like domain-containing protein [Polymorphobacter multimanifer]MBB6227496.1 hypothetical protein [Polymorphobacter multimanifer]